MTTENQVYEAGGARIGELREQFRRCAPFNSAGAESQVAVNERVRYTRWSGQSDDGRKHDTEEEQAFPWEGASDTRVPLADEIINELVATQFVAFHRATLNTQATDTHDLEESGQVAKVLDWLLRYKLRRPLAEEVELSAQWMQTVGWVVLHVYWDRKVSRYNRTVRLSELASLAQALAAQDPASPLAQLPALIADPTLEESAGALLGQLYRVYVQAEVRGLADVDFPELPASRFRRMARELRETGETAVPVPMIVRNQPAVVALKPWEDIVVSELCSDIQEEDVVFRRVFMTETQLRSEAHLADWDAAWVEAAVRVKGQVTSWVSQETPGLMRVQQAVLAQYADLVEVWYAYRRLLDADDVPGIWQTVFHPLIDQDAVGRELCGKHELLDYLHGQQPFVLGRREAIDRALVTSRGVPEIARWWQEEVKVQRDSLVDQTSFTTLPPILVPTGMETLYKFGPAVQVECYPGREPKFMAPPGATTPAFLLLEAIEGAVDNYFGRWSAKVPPARTQTKLQMATEKFLLLWMGAFDQVNALVKQFMPAEVVERITGSPPVWQRGGTAIAGGYDVMLNFDVKELDADFLLKKLQMISQFVLPEDTAGVIDRAKLVNLKLRALDPNYARELTMDVGAASQAQFRQVMTDVALMALGNEAEYTENDPAAPMKLKFLAQIIRANPKYQGALQQDERFRGLLTNYEQNLQQSVVQQQNKLVGRLGVKPMDGAAAAGGGMGASGPMGPMGPM